MERRHGVSMKVNPILGDQKNTSPPGEQQCASQPCMLARNFLNKKTKIRHIGKHFSDCVCLNASPLNLHRCSRAQGSAHQTMS